MLAKNAQVSTRPEQPAAHWPNASQFDASRFLRMTKRRDWCLFVFLLWYASMLLNYLSKLVLRMSGGPTGGPWVSCRGSPAKVQQNIWLKVGMWTKVLIGCNLQESWRLFCSFKPKKTIIYICCNGPSWRKVWEDTRCIRLYSYQPGQVELGKDYRQFRREESVQ